MRNAVVWGLVLAGMSLPVQAVESASEQSMRRELDQLKQELERLAPLRERVKALEQRLAAQPDDNASGQGQSQQLAQSESGASEDQATNANNAAGEGMSSNNQNQQSGATSQSSSSDTGTATSYSTGSGSGSDSQKQSGSGQTTESGASEDQAKNANDAAGEGMSSNNDGQQSASTSDSSSSDTGVDTSSSSGSGSGSDSKKNKKSGDGKKLGEIGTVQISTGAGEPRTVRSKSNIETIATDVYEKKQSKSVKVGGALRYNFTYAEFNESQKDRRGDIGLDTFRINADADIDGLLFSAEYRFYNFMRTLHHGWVGYQFTDKQHIEIGLNRVPFGVLPYASNNFYFSSNYYTGFEDDYDIGVKYVYKPGQWNLQFAFYKNAEGNGNNRYSVDPIGLNPQLTDADGDSVPATQFAGGLADNNTFAGYGESIQETNTVNTRIAYNIKHKKDYVSEVGVSGQAGQIYNNTQTENYGHDLAAALHLHGNYGPWEVMLEAARYDYDLDGNEDVIGTGFFSANYGIPAEATSWLGNISYTFQLDYGPFDSLEIYNDYSYIGNKSGGFANTWQNVTGAALAAGNLYTYFDIINGKNEPFVNGSLVGDREKAQTLFNINMGYYF